MNLRRRQLLAAGILGTVAVLGLAWLTRLDFAAKVSTDVLDLLPAADRAPELGMVRSLASETEARVMFFVLTDAAGAPAPAGAAHRFAGELARQPGFDQALALDDPAPREAMAKALFDQRLTLLFPSWLHEQVARQAGKGVSSSQMAEALSADAAAELGRFLATPEALAFQDLLPSDPLLLMPTLAGRLKGALALIEPASRAPAAAGADPIPTRVWARIAVSPLREEGQEPIFAAIARATEATRAEFPGVNVAYTGVNRFAAASKARIQRELSWLNGLSLAAVLAVAFVCIRSVHRALHLVPPVLFAVLGAWIGVTMAFSRVHILVFVVGALLTGVAIDYGFYLYMQPPARPDEDYWEKVRRLAKPLFSSCFTTVAGFGLLLFSDLPLIRQLGVFVGAGLVCALAAALVYFSMLRNSYLEARPLASSRAFASGTRRSIRRLLLAVWLLALPGLFFLKWKDDIRDLEIPSPAIQREDARIRALFGDSTDRTVYLTHGATPGEARTALGRLDAWLGRAGNGHTESVNLGAVIPTPEDYAEAGRFVREHPEFPERLRAALIAAGFEENGFAPFFDAYAHYATTAGATTLEEATGKLSASLTGPVALLLHVGHPMSWFVTLASHAPETAPPPETQTVSASQLQSLNRIFGQYRSSALWLSLTGLAIVGAGVFLAYGLKDGLRIFAIPCGACLGLFGLFGWFGQPLNLFHLLGAFLGVCLTHNYSIFSATSAYRREPPPVSVRLSALTAIASFGALACSGIPVVRALGETVACMVLAALLAIEFEHFNAFSSSSRS
jgi:predicted exporter